MIFKRYYDKKSKIMETMIIGTHEIKVFQGFVLYFSNVKVNLGLMSFFFRLFKVVKVFKVCWQLWTLGEYVSRWFDSMSYLEIGQHQRRSVLWKAVNYIWKTFHLRSSIGFWISMQLKLCHEATTSQHNMKFDATLNFFYRPDKYGRALKKIT